MFPLLTFGGNGKQNQTESKTQQADAKANHRMDIVRKYNLLNINRLKDSKILISLLLV